VVIVPNNACRRPTTEHLFRAPWRPTLVGEASNRDRFITMALVFRPALSSDGPLLYRLMREAIGPYVTQLWGWDEAFQQERWARVFDPSRWQIIADGRQDVGGLELEHRPDELYLANLLIFPEHQGRGIGTAVIRGLLSTSHAEGKPLRLQVLKVNPARALYARLGFVEQGETETHYLMVAPPPG
jgi:ribosomal protein S18 acetylase RimI-like enzyme